MKVKQPKLPLSKPVGIPLCLTGGFPKTMGMMMAYFAKKKKSDGIFITLF